MARTITHDGRTLTLYQWALATGIPEGTIRSRLDRLGMTVAEALTRPPDRRFRPDAGRRARAVRPAPAYLCDARGRAYSRWTDPVTHQRRRRVWGRYGDPEAERAYRRWAAEWLVSGGGDPDQVAVSVARLALRYVEYAEQTYRKHGRITSEVHGIRAALRDVVDLYGDTAAAELTPQRLMAVQRRWAERLSVTTANGYLHRVVRCWSWGVSRGLVPAATADALAHVPTLRAGRSAARPPRRVTAAPDAALEAALPHLHPDPTRQRVLETILRLQRLTGMRPGEVLELRPRDLDRSRTPWVYTPPSGGKTLHLDRPRRVYLGPQARALLATWLQECPAGERVFRLPRAGGRMVPVRIEYLRWRLAEGCRIAGVPVVTPHQIRHTYATDLHQRYEDDAAVAAAIGDTPEVARHIYVDDPADAAARRIAETVG